MNRLIISRITVFIICVVSLTSYAQFGIKLGVNISKLAQSGSGGGYKLLNSKFLIGGQGGVYFNKSILYGEKANDLTIRGEALEGISEAYINMKQHNKAEPYAQEALDIAIKAGAIQYQKENI